MSSPDELEPLSPDLVRLLTAEKARPAPPASMQARILERFGQELLDGGAAAGNAAPPVANVPTAAPWRRLPLTAALLAAGGLGGAGIHAWLQPRPRPAAPVVLPTAPPPRSEPPPAPLPPPPAPAPAPPPRAAPHGATVRRNSAPAAPAILLPPTAAAEDAPPPLTKDQALAAERALVEQARTALARGNAADALTVLERHRAQFEHGRLAEERDGLRILALLANHQAGTAHARAAEFRRAYPHSVLIRTIDDALAGAR